MDPTHTELPSPPTCFDPSLSLEPSSPIANAIHPALLPHPIAQQQHIHLDNSTHQILDSEHLSLLFDDIHATLPTTSTKETAHRGLLNDSQAVLPPSPQRGDLNQLPTQTTTSSLRLTHDTDSDLDQPVMLTTKFKKSNHSKQDHHVIKHHPHIKKHSPKLFKLNSNSNESNQHQINITPTCLPIKTDIPDYPKLGDCFETLDRFKYTCMRASWPRGHQIHIRTSNKTPSPSVTTVFACNRDRAPPKGDSCRFRVSITSDDGETDWRVISTQLEHSNHNPQPGDYRPNPKQRDWLLSFDLELEQKAQAANEFKAQTENQIEIESETDVENQTEDENENGIVAIKSDEWTKINTSRVQNRKGQVWAQSTVSKKVMNENLSDEEEEIEISRNLQKHKRKKLSINEKQKNSIRKRDTKEVSSITTTTTSSPAVRANFSESEEEEKATKKTCSNKPRSFQGVFIPLSTVHSQFQHRTRKSSKRISYSQNISLSSSAVDELDQSMEHDKSPEPESSPAAIKFDSRRSKAILTDGSLDFDESVTGNLSPVALRIEPGRRKRKIRNPKLFPKSPIVVLDEPDDEQTENKPRRNSKRRSRGKEVCLPISSEDQIEERTCSNVKRRRSEIESVAMSTSNLKNVVSPRVIPTNGLGFNIDHSTPLIGSSESVDESVEVDGERVKLKSMIDDLLSHTSHLIQEPEPEFESESLENLLKSCHYKFPPLLTDFESAGLITSSSVLNLNQASLFNLLKFKESWISILLWRRLRGREKCELVDEINPNDPDCQCWCWPKPFINNSELKGLKKCQNCKFWIF